jgi:hypothetical protein
VGALVDHHDLFGTSGRSSYPSFSTRAGVVYDRAVPVLVVTPDDRPSAGVPAPPDSPANVPGAPEPSPGPDEPLLPGEGEPEPEPDSPDDDE